MLKTWPRGNAVIVSARSWRRVREDTRPLLLAIVGWPISRGIREIPRARARGKGAGEVADAERGTKLSLTRAASP